MIVEASISPEMTDNFGRPAMLERAKLRERCSAKLGEKAP